MVRRLFEVEVEVVWGDGRNRGRGKEGKKGGKEEERRRRKRGEGGREEKGGRDGREGTEAEAPIPAWAWSEGWDRGET